MIIEARKILSNNYTQGDCAVCGGDSDGGVPVKKAVSGSFTDWQALYAASGRKCCPKCREIIANPGMRTKCVMCVSNGEIQFGKYEDIYHIVKNPPERFVISVPYSYKRHHWLYAGLSTPQKMLIGTDTETVEYRPVKHGIVLDAIETMIAAGVSAKQIESGNYHPSSIALLGAKYDELENIISQHRGNGLIRLLCKIVPKEKIDNWEVEELRTSEQSNAALYLRALASCSKFKAENGMQFWGGFFEARVNRVLDLPFEEATNKLMESLQCSPSAWIAKLIDELTDDQKKEIMETLKKQAKVCISLAYSDMKKERV